ncbi:hypothetical protein BDW72DRAFT_81618 [Aspergillus terricola var. indicus]
MRTLSAPSALSALNTARSGVPLAGAPAIICTSNITLLSFSVEERRCIDSSSTPHYSEHAETNVKPALLPVQGERGAALHPIIPASSAQPARLPPHRRDALVSAASNWLRPFCCRPSPSFTVLQSESPILAPWMPLHLRSIQLQRLQKTPESFTRPEWRPPPSVPPVPSVPAWPVILAIRSRPHVPWLSPEAPVHRARPESLPRVGRFQVNMSHSHKVLDLRFAG